MPHPKTVLTYIAGAYSSGMGALLCSVAAYRLLADHGLKAGGYPAEMMSPVEAGSFILWLLCTVFCGWSVMSAAADKAVQS